LPKRVSKASTPAAAREKALFVEDAVRRQEELAMHVQDVLRAPVDVQVERRIVVRSLGVLVKAGDDVDGRPIRAGVGPPGLAQPLR
jgi:hypothetical protein